MEITIGAKHTVTAVVDKSNTASAVGSGLLDVFATPMMIALMEQAAAQCLGQFLPQEQSSVGTAVSITHDAATPLGMKVSATAEITAVDRRRVEFTVTAQDEAGIIGGGTHSRFIIDKDKFMQKTGEKAAK